MALTPHTTLLFEDTFTGTAGALSGHSPTTDNRGTSAGTWDAETGWNLDGAGNAVADGSSNRHTTINAALDGVDQTEYTVEVVLVADSGGNRGGSIILCDQRINSGYWYELRIDDSTPYNGNTDNIALVRISGSTFNGTLATTNIDLSADCSIRATVVPDGTGQAQISVWRGDTNYANYVVASDWAVDDATTGADSEIIVDNNTSKQLTVTSWSGLWNQYNADMEVAGYRVSYTASADTTAPTISSVTATATGATTADVGATSDEDGTGWAVILPSGAAAPTGAQVKAGTDGNDAAATATGSTACTAATPFSIGMTGLGAGTTYDVYVTAEDAANNVQATPLSTTVTTDSPPSLTLTLKGKADDQPVASAGISYAIRNSGTPLSAAADVSGTDTTDASGVVTITSGSLSGPVDVTVEVTSGTYSGQTLHAQAVALD